MRGGGHRQEFGEALDYAQDDGGDDVVHVSELASWMGWSSPPREESL